MPISDDSLSVLLKVATPDIYRLNAFRLTGLTVTATAREVARQADKLKMLAEVGGNAADKLSVIPGMRPPTAEEVRNASHRLKDLQTRAIDEFFWFWPEDWAHPEHDDAITALKRHDLDSAFTIWARRELDSGSFIAARNVALVLHMRAIEWALLDFTHPLSSEQLEMIHGYWRQAFDRLEWLADDDRLWDTFKIRIRQINDPTLTTGFARRLRSELPMAFDKINAELALEYAKRNRNEEARWHVEFLMSTHAELDDTRSIIDLVLHPTRSHVDDAIKSVASRSNRNKMDGLIESERLIATTEPLLALISTLHSPNSPDAEHYFDEVANTALNCAGQAYKTIANQTNQGGTNTSTPRSSIEAGAQFISILHKLKRIAKDQELVETIGGIIPQVESNITFERDLKPLLDAAVKIRDTRGIKAVEKLNRISTQVLPAVDALISRKSLPSDLMNELCDGIASILRGLGIEANNNDSMPGVASQAMNAALRYAKDGQLKERLKQDVQAAKLNQQAKFSGNKSGCCIPLFFAITGAISAAYLVLTSLIYPNLP